MVVVLVGGKYMKYVGFVDVGYDFGVVDVML